MRITGGALRGRRLHTPKSSAIRPMRDQVRAALFNILSDVVEGSRILDLFAGTGSVGIEALSRGAKFALFVDQSREAIQILNQNLSDLDVTESSEVIQEDVFSVIGDLEAHDENFDLIFIGPPYNKNLADQALQRLGTSGILCDNSIVFAEVFKKEALQLTYGELIEFDTRKYGDNLIRFYQLGARNDSE